MAAGSVHVILGERATGRMRARDPARGREIMVEVASRAVDRALAGPLPEALARSVVRHDVVGRIAAELRAAADADALDLDEAERLARRVVASSAFQRVVLDALESQLTPELVDRLLENPEIERVVESIVSGPAVRAALTRQTTSFADEVAAAVLRRATRLDEAVRASLAPYAGVATRGIAFGIDLAVAGAIYLAVTAMFGLVTWLAGGLQPGWLVAGIAAAAWTLLAGSYFALFWTVAGQTPGMRFMRLRVLTRSGAAPGAGRSAARFLALLLAIAPLFAGLLPILFDARRRGLHDLLAGTVVVHEDHSDTASP
jgi:uncharacterized RDD family membrane protein YckC